MIYLTRKQRELLDFITVYVGKHDGVAPSFDEMADGIGLASKSGVHRLMDSLEERGYVRRLPRRARAIELVAATSNPTKEAFRQRLLASLDAYKGDHLFSVDAVRRWVKEAQ